MAASTGGSSSSSNDSPWHKYCCTLCKQPMVNPRVLSCLHVLCEQCLIYLQYAVQGNKDENWIECPDCKKTVTIGLSGSTPLTISSYLFYCSSCVKDTNSVFRCRYCEKLFCTDCFTDHSFVICQMTDDAKRFIHCNQHNMECKYYCQKCDIMACVFCLTKDAHQSDAHNYVSVTEAEKTAHDHIQKVLDDAKEHTNQCYDTISCLLNVLTDLRCKHETAKDELTVMFDSFRKLCDKYYKDATDDLNGIYETQDNKVMKLLHEIKSFGATIGNSCKEAKSLLMEADSFALCKLGTLAPIQDLQLYPIPDIQMMNGSKAETEKAFRIVLDDFHEKMNVNLSEFTASLNLEALETKGFSAGSDDTKLNGSVALWHDAVKRTPLPINIKYKFGTMGDLQMEFNHPSGFCLNSKEDIIIADKHNHRIQIFRKNGTFKFKFGMAGKIDGHLWFPSKVAVLPNGNRIVVADQGVERWRLQIFSRNGIFIRKVPFERDISNVAAMAVFDGRIVIVDQSNSLTHIINECGDVISYFECKNYICQPSDVAVYDAQIFICDFKAHRVAVFSMTGVFHRYIGNKDVFSYPSGIHVTEDDVFVSDSNNTRIHVSRLGRDGVFKASYVCMQMKVSHCHGFKMNSDGDAFTVSKSNHSMFILDRMSFKQ